MVYGANPIEVDADYDVAIELNGTVADGIRPVLQQLNQQATVYDMAGRVVVRSA